MTTIENQTHLLEQNQRLSASILWQLQRNFFNQQGLNAWRNGTVPHYITSNPTIARAYTQVVFGWLRDLVAIPKNNAGAALDPSQPVYIVELGAGSGRLAYHFLKTFFSFYDESALKHVPIQYIMTDFSRPTVDTWQSHPQLQPWVEAGRLDFACFDAEQDQSLTLINGGKTLTAETLTNPLAVLANYVFDGLAQDLFYIEKEQLYASLISLTVPQPASDLNDPGLLERSEITYSRQAISGDYYDDPAFNQILSSYQKTLTQTNLLFPIGALQCLRTLDRLSNRRFMLISGDKGYHHTADLLFRAEPDLAIHGSFSMMVNYHALGQYILNQEGQFLSTFHRPNKLDICAFLVGQSPRDYPETCHAYRLVVAQGGPDDFFVLKKGLENHYQELTLPQLLAYLRLSGWDSNIFLGCFPMLMKRLGEAPHDLKEELNWAVRQIWETYYHIGEEWDLPFFLGILLYSLEYYPEAISYLQHSLHLYGPDATTLFNLGMCYYELERLETALEFILEAIEVDPGFEPAQAMRVKLEVELQPRQEG